MLLDLHHFYRQMPKPYRPDEDRKLAGISGWVMLEPYWQNTYLASRVSFPNYKFDYSATIDLQKK